MTYPHNWPKMITMCITTEILYKCDGDFYFRRQLNFLDTIGLA